MSPLSAQLPLGTRARDNARPMSDSASPPPHLHKVTLLLAIAGLLVAGYSLWRGDSTRDREDATRDRVSVLESANAALRAELAAASERESKAREELQRQWQSLADLPTQVRDLTSSHEDLRARTERPQRAWSRAEALYLIELAQRRLNFDRDVQTAIAALEAADARLASLRDPSLNAARARIARDLQALRAVPDPDVAGVLARISAIESQIGDLQLRGVMAGERFDVEQPDDSRSIFRRAWESVTGAFANLFTVHRLDDAHGAVVSMEQQMLRRQHVSLLAFAARQAAMRGDGATYTATVNEMREWLVRYFGASATADAVAQELTALAAIDIAPKLPDVSGAAALLLRGSASPPARNEAQPDAQ